MKRLKALFSSLDEYARRIELIHGEFWFFFFYFFAHLKSNNVHNGTCFSVTRFNAWVEAGCVFYFESSFIKRVDWINIKFIFDGYLIINSTWKRWFWMIKIPQNNFQWAFHENLLSFCDTCYTCYNSFTLVNKTFISSKKKVSTYIKLKEGCKKFHFQSWSYHEKFLCRHLEFFYVCYLFSDFDRFAAIKSTRVKKLTSTFF